MRKLKRGRSNLASAVLGVPAADARSPKELRERKAGDQGAATNAGGEEDQFFGDDLQSNACRVGDEAGETSLVRVRRLYRHRRSPRLGGLPVSPRIQGNRGNAWAAI